METVFGIDRVHVVKVDGSPSGRKEHIVWNPPFIDKTNVTQGRVHTITEASRVFRFLMDRGIRAIVFCKVQSSFKRYFRFKILSALFFDTDSQNLRASYEASQAGSRC